MDSRELAYFVAVAEELNFGRAAERLGIAQPPLSRAIRQLERRLGVALLTRTSRRVELTRAGEILLHDGRKALTALAAAERRVRRTTLVVATKPGGDAGLLGPILAEFASSPEAVEVELELCGVGEQAELLRDGRADVAFLHLPYDDPAGFAVEELLVQGQVAVLPDTYPLAAQEKLTLTDLADEPRPRWPGTPGEGPVIRDGMQLFQLISLGRVVAVLPEAATSQLSAGLVAVPVIDAPPTIVALAWPEDSRSRPVAAFVRIACGLTG